MPTLYVMCREPLPPREDGWSFQAGPVTVVQEDELLLHLTTPTFATGLVAEALGELIARATRGVLCADGPRLLADFESESAEGHAEFARQLEELLGDLEAELVHEANDWSDVESAA